MISLVDIARVENVDRYSVLLSLLSERNIRCFNTFDILKATDDKESKEFEKSLEFELVDTLARKKRQY